MFTQSFTYPIDIGSNPFLFEDAQDNPGTMSIDPTISKRGGCADAATRPTPSSRRAVSAATAVSGGCAVSARTSTWKYWLISETEKRGGMEPEGGGTGDGERRSSRGQGPRGGPRRRRWRRDRATARRPWRRWSWSQLATADGRRRSRRRAAAPGICCWAVGIVGGPVDKKMGREKPNFHFIWTGLGCVEQLLFQCSRIINKRNVPPRRSNYSQATWDLPRDLEPARRRSAGWAVGAGLGERRGSWAERARGAGPSLYD